MISLEQATSFIYKLAHTINFDEEQVDIENIVDRYSKNDVFSKLNHQSFRSSAMDGYAVLSSDFQSKTLPELEVIGTQAAGSQFVDYKLKKNQAVKIFTGAIVPANADAILIVEHTKPISKDKILATQKVVEGQYIREIGLDYKIGSLLLPALTKISSYQQVLLASSGIAKLPIIKQPKASVVALGSELKIPSETLSFGQIYASSQYGISSLLTRFGYTTNFSKIIPDKFDQIEEYIKHEKSDFIITTGSASKGDLDYLPKILKKHIIFQGINLKPGKPTILAKIDSKLILALPGNPVSSLVVLNLLLPFLSAGFLKQNKPKLKYKKAIYKGSKQKAYERQTFLSAINTKKDGQYVVTAIENQDSSCVSSLAKANCLIRIEPNQEVDNDKEVEYLKLL